MKVDILKYLRSYILPILYERTDEGGASIVKDLENPGGLPTRRNVPEIKIDNFETRHSLPLFFLVLSLLILACGLLIKYLLFYFPTLQEQDMPLIVSVLLITLLSPVLYALFYRPMVRQFRKLRIAVAMMQDFAFIDVLTELYNRRGFLMYAEHLLKLSDRTKKGLILIYADLDNMKQINDVFGHQEGDRALMTTANVLKKTFRDSDVIGRVGGDEFVILALEAKAESLDALRLRLNNNLRKARNNKGAAHKLSFSLGIIYYNPEKPQTIEELLKKADILMYQDKMSASHR